MNVVQVPVDALIPYARNARTHSPEQVAQIAASIKEFGFNVPILVDGSRGLIAGHGRLLAARKLGLETVPCIELSHLSETQKRAYILADNQLALNAGWDNEMLSLELRELDIAGFDLDLIGFGTELDDLLGLDEGEEGGGDSGVDEDEGVPEPPAKPVSRIGDIWAINNHLLICGDSTDKATVLALTAGERASLCFTSPPYGNQRDYTSGGISNWDGLMQGVFRNLPMADDGQVLVNLGLIHRDNEFIPYWDAWLAWMKSQGWRRFGWYVWDQGAGLPGDWNGRLSPSFEFVFHFNRQSKHPNKFIDKKPESIKDKTGESSLRKSNGDIVSVTNGKASLQPQKIPDSVLRINRHCGGIGDGISHPAVFPVALPAFVMEAYSAENDIVFEPFSGSGTSILAAERTGRQCRAIELAPEYVDVAIKRFLQHHPDADVALRSTGQSWEEVVDERGGDEQ